MGAVHITFPALCFVLASLPGAAVGGRSVPPDTLRFVRPAPGEVITTNSLPIEVEPRTGRPVDSVVFLATYLDAGYSESDTVFRHWRLRHLATDSVSPYRTIWDIAQLQDHYHRRILINARAYLSDGDTLKSGIDDFVVDRNPALKTQYVARALPAKSRGDNRKHRWDTNGRRFSVADNRVHFLVEWSPETLFVAVQVVDAAIFAVPPDDDRFWGGDQVEFYLDLGGERAVLESDSLRQFIAAADGRAYGGRLPIWFSKNHVPVGVEHARLDSGYRLSLSVAWADIGLAHPLAGDTLGFDLSAFDRDGKDGLVSMGTWAGNHLGNHHNASEWGILVLTDTPVGPRLVVAAILVGGALAAAGLLLVRKRRRFAAVSIEAVEEEAREQLFDRNAVSSLTAAALDIVDRDYTEESCNLEYVATKLDRTPKHISAVFRKETGMRFTDYLNEVRLLTADQLLRTTHKTAFDVSIQVGYHSYEYFSRTYKKRFGISPSKAREATG